MTCTGETKPVKWCNKNEEKNRNCLWTMITDYMIKYDNVQKCSNNDLG